MLFLANSGLWGSISNIGIDTLSYGIPYAILALGIFLSFRILDFADLTCEGSFTLGAAVTAIIATSGLSPYLGLFLSLIAGMLAGALTGILNAKLKIPPLLSGIIVLSALFTINLIIMGIANDGVFNFFQSFNTKVSVPIENRFYYPLYNWLIEVFPNFKPKYAATIMLFVILAIVCMLVYFFYGTEIGMGIRATGMNPVMARAQGINTDTMIILGLAISNGLISLAGALMSQVSGSASSTMSIGVLVIGIASIIIGEAIIGKKTFKQNLIAVIIGTIIYYLITDIIIMTGILGSHFLKLLYAIIIVVVLAFSNIKTNKKRKIVKVEGATNA